MHSFQGVLLTLAVTHMRSDELQQFCHISVRFHGVICNLCFQLLAKRFAALPQCYVEGLLQIPGVHIMCLPCLVALLLPGALESLRLFFRDTDSTVYVVQVHHRECRIRWRVMYRARQLLDCPARTMRLLERPGYALLDLLMCFVESVRHSRSNIKYRSFHSFVFPREFLGGGSCTRTALDLLLSAASGVGRESSRSSGGGSPVGHGSISYNL
mmetsp:Transcript_59729/g.176988  ORF Transcript_59729/g.176988 Transcript_59729/m.176988 type:complete len:213 (-) Transcript_59729:162-800(-)